MFPNPLPWWTQFLQQQPTPPQSGKFMGYANQLNTPMAVNLSLQNIRNGVQPGKRPWWASDPRKPKQKAKRREFQNFDSRKGYNLEG
jgi:hypothetical protein